MLQISQMAKLANTTRRTLLYYDQEGLFQPRKKSTSGYRYYEYDQLYDLLFILGLKDLGVPLGDVKKIVQQPDQLSYRQVQLIQQRIDKQSEKLHRVQAVVDKMAATYRAESAPTVLTIQEAELPEKLFWCSPRSASCTEKEVAMIFADFYRELGHLAMVSNTQSGYLTTLSLTNPTGYKTASFRVIKEVVDRKAAVVPMVVKPAGRYVIIGVENSMASVQFGLSKLKNYCHQHRLKTGSALWQINTSSRLNSKGASRTMWLEYRLK